MSGTQHIFPLHSLIRCACICTPSSTPPHLPIVSMDELHIDTTNHPPSSPGNSPSYIHFPVPPRVMIVQGILVYMHINIRNHAYLVSSSCRFLPEMFILPYFPIHWLRKLNKPFHVVAILSYQLLQVFLYGKWGVQVIECFIGPCEYGLLWMRYTCKKKGANQSISDTLRCNTTTWMTHL